MIWALENRKRIMANYVNHQRLRNSTNQFRVLDIRKISPALKKAYGVSIDITTTTPNYGGTRDWWLCKCGRRVACMYQHCGRWKCRHCLNAVHQSTQDSKCDRNLNQMWKTIERYGLHEKYGVDGFSKLYDFHKPPRMHRTTWARIVDKYNKHHVQNMAYLSIMTSKRK